jgi:pre-mRNA-processing factor 17
MNVNIPYSDMMLPIQGPENPFGDRNRFVNQNALAGHVEEQDMTEHAFRQQHLTYAILGYAANPSVDPSAPAIVGDAAAAQAHGFRTADALQASRAEKKELKRKRKARGDLEVADGEGAYVGPWGAWEGDQPKSVVPEGVDPTAEAEEDEESEEEVMTKKAKPKKGAPGQEHSVFHGKAMTDYQGRTYMSPPLSEAPQLQSEPGSQDTFIPKVCIHTWTGHTQGVSVIRTFPQTGHLFLSGSMDTKIKVSPPRKHSSYARSEDNTQLWDIYTHGNCLRTFHGHVKAVKDVTFSNDGRRFLSCGYDRQMKLWDTETGQCIKRFSNGKIPYVVKFHPDEDKQHIFLAGMSDKKIIQVYVRSSRRSEPADRSHSTT